MARFLQAALAVHGKAWKSAASVGLRTPAERFDVVKGDSIDNGSGRCAVSSSPGGGTWAAGNSGGMPRNAEECIESCLPLVLSLEPCEVACSCPRPSLQWRLTGEGRVRSWAAGGSGGWLRRVHRNVPLFLMSAGLCRVLRKKT